ncbi:hypothetical protein ACF0H5_004228 [Mactra antiquata]
MGTWVKVLDNTVDDQSDGYTFDSWSSMHISESDKYQTKITDVLDLQKRAEELAEKMLLRVTKNISAEEMRQYIPLAQADFKMIRHTDKYLKETYDFYYEPALDHAPQVKEDTKALIDKLLKRPHFYCPDEREESTWCHVNRWLTNYTSSPEKELVGFSANDPYEPVKCIPNLAPKLSTSETNVILGKRKRCADIDDEDSGGVYVSSSDTRLVRPTARRCKKIRRVS